MKIFFLNKLFLKIQNCMDTALKDFWNHFITIKLNIACIILCKLLYLSNLEFFIIFIVTRLISVTSKMYIKSIYKKLTLYSFSRFFSKAKHDCKYKQKLQLFFLITRNPKNKIFDIETVNFLTNCFKNTYLFFFVTMNFSYKILPFSKWHLHKKIRWWKYF